MEIVTPPAPNLLERFNQWIQESIMVKLFSIGFLILILLIPSVWIQELISERQQRAEEVIGEVADKWSGSQTISGPILVIPYRKIDVVDKGKDGKEIHETIERAFFLPDQLNIQGTVNPEVLQRGIFDAVVYGSSMKINSTFAKPDFKALSISEELVNWKDAYLIFGITDLRGISDNPAIKIGDSLVSAEPSNNIGVTVYKRLSATGSDYVTDANETTSVSSAKGIVAKTGWTDANSFKGDITIALNMKGSERLDFIPVGKTTEVKMSGPWTSPSFDGEFLPAERNVTATDFTASWKILHFNRPFSQQWTNDNQSLSGSDFGLKLLVPVDQYQKSMRTSKYGVLVVLLTFMALFLVEITQKIRIHPFQYILIGIALIIYYTLLLSISEHLGYNIAYVVASAATVALISLYSTTFLNTKLTLLFTALLVVFYTFIFVIILQQDFSLLLGSVGLFLIIGCLMYFSRKVNWYRQTAA